MLDKTPPDVPSGVVIAVQLLPAFQTLELVTITVVLVREPALTMNFAYLLLFLLSGKSSS